MKFIQRYLPILALILWLSPQFATAQQSKWESRIDSTFVFEITNKEAEKLLGKAPADHQIKKLMHTQVASFTEKWDTPPQQGHFIFANIRQNKVVHRYVPIMPFKVFLHKEYGVLSLQVVDGKGELRRDAKVRISRGGRLFNTAVSFDRESGTYRIDDQSEKEDRMLTVELDGFRAVFDLTKHFVPSWYDRGGERPYSPDFYGYMITDKNKYKPGEKVRFKAYALTGNRRPLKKELEVWLWIDYNNSRKISTLTPYHPGGYAGEVQLHDSLGLRLDKRYSIQLREPGGRIVSSQGFSYEDYVLYDNSLTASLSDYVHYYPNANFLEIKAVDANGLPLPDVKAEVLVSRVRVDKSYTEILTIPDTMMFRRVNLDNSSPTRIEIPTDVFGESDGSYRVSVTVVTLDGQRMTASDMASFFRFRRSVEVETRGDTIRFEHCMLGVPVAASGRLFYGDAKEGKKVSFPHEEPFGQTVTGYRVTIDGTDFERDIPTGRIPSKLDVKGGISRDSFNITLVNPLGLEVSWYAYQGNKLVAKGSGKEMEVKFPDTDLTKAHYLEVFYVMGDSEQLFRRTFVPKTEFLSIELDMPGRVYPGQTLDATVTVKDHLGYPVRDADLTAFAYNSLLNYWVPDLDYYGPQPQTREQRSSYSINRRGYSFETRIDYDYWKDRAGLDKAPYYRFTYPREGMFINTEDTPDGITQFAPYVMKNGEAVNIYVIEINDEPVWFSWTQQPQAYSFPVIDSIAHKVTLRLHDRALVFEAGPFEKGKKTIMSLDPDRLPAEVRTLRLRDKDERGNSVFTPSERGRYHKMIARMPVHSLSDGNWLSYEGGSTLIYHPELSGSAYNVLAGPLPSVRAQYSGSVWYRHEGGYRYSFDENVVYKYPDDGLLPKTLSFSAGNAWPLLNDFYLSPQVLKKQLEKIYDKVRRWYPSEIYISGHGVNLNFRLSARLDTTGVAGLILLKGDSIRFAYTNQRNKADKYDPPIAPGVYNAVLLYNNGKYLRRDGVPLRHNAYIEVDMTGLAVNPADSVSMEWLKRFLVPITANASPVVRTHTFYLRTATGYGNTIAGTVCDTSGEPLIGAAIRLKGTQYGTITDIDGRFQFEIDGGDHTLQISYVGFITKELEVNPGLTVHVVLEESVSMLEEVVMVGYGTARKSSLTGAMGYVVTNYADPQAPPEELDDDDDDSVQEATDKLYRELLMIGGLRSNFSDVGFWEPALVTDRRGKASFRVTFPDNITKWNAVVYAMNRRLKTGTLRRSVNSYKPLMAELRMPQFLVKGDTTLVTGNIRNYTGEGTIRGNSTFIRNDSDTLSRTRVEFAASYPERTAVTPSGTDSLSVTYLFTRDDGYTDGEKRTVGIIPVGTEIADGVLGFLREGETVDIPTGADEAVELMVTGNQMDVYLDASWYLYGYRHDCNEQLASKLIGLLAIKLYNRYEGKKFSYDSRVNEIIRRLTGNRNENLLWSWFGNSQGTSFWMSAHVMTALKMARDQGYTVNLDLTQLENDYLDTTSVRDRSMRDIEVLNMLSQWGAKQNYAPAVEYWEQWIRQREHVGDSIAQKHNVKRMSSYLKEKLLLWEIRQMHGLDFRADNVEEYLQTDVLGALYCDDGITRSWYNDNLITTLIAYRIVSADSTLMRHKEAMQMYILGTKRGGWNTYRSASAIATVFPGLLAEAYSKETPATLHISGRENKTVTEFPYAATLLPGERIGLRKGQGMPLIYSAYTRKTVTEARTGEAFDISTRLSGNGEFRVGSIDTLVVQVKVKQENAEHVMIEVPIPAGCDYASKLSYNSWPEVHREHYKEKAVIFCESMPKGEYSFRILLLPRYSGSYTVNPAKVELMYFPVVSANNDVGRMRIE